MGQKSAPAAPSVLVVDDERGLREMLVFNLSRCGYRVALAANGEEALALARRDDFDAALCDITMPGINGVDTLQALKKLRPRLEVVMTTGYATPETAVASMRLGASDYIAKPFTLDELETVLARAVARARGARR